MTLKYESELLFDLMKRDGENAPSDVLPYESELKEKYLNQVIGAYPKLQDYRAEWLNYALYYNLPSDFPIESVTNVTSVSFNNVVPYAYQSAILKGNTGYRDIDTGEILESFEEGRNLELVSVKMPVLTTTGKNLFNINGEFITNGATYSINGNSLTVTGIWFARQVVDLKPNTTYTLSYEKVESDSGFIKTAVYTNGISNGVGQSSTNKLTFTTPPSFKDISVIFFSEQGKNTNTVTYTNIQLEKGTVATTYKPHKSNILTVNEGVTLRSNGSVCDELDLLTGKLTQRIDEDGEILTQEVVKTVDLSCINEQGESETFRPIEGTMHVSTSSQTLPPLLDMSVPIEATSQNLISFANILEEE